MTTKVLAGIKQGVLVTLKKAAERDTHATFTAKQLSAATGLPVSDIKESLVDLLAEKFVTQLPGGFRISAVGHRADFTVGAASFTGGYKPGDRVLIKAGVMDSRAMFGTVVGPMKYVTNKPTDLVRVQLDAGPTDEFSLNELEPAGADDPGRYGGPGSPGFTARKAKFASDGGAGKDALKKAILAWLKTTGPQFQPYIEMMLPLPPGLENVDSNEIEDAIIELMKEGKLKETGLESPAGPQYGVTFTARADAARKRVHYSEADLYATTQAALAKFAIEDADGKDVPEEYLLFLDQLRESGKTNMFGAAPYLQSMFGVAPAEAKRILIFWMKTFEGRMRGGGAQGFLVSPKNLVGRFIAGKAVAR